MTSCRLMGLAHAGIIATDLDPKDLPPGLTVSELQAKLAGHKKGAAGLVGSYVNPYPN